MFCSFLWYRTKRANTSPDGERRVPHVTIFINDGNDIRTKGQRIYWKATGLPESESMYLPVCLGS